MTWIRFFFFLQQKQGSTCKKWRITRIRKLNNFISRNRIVFIVSYFIPSSEVVLRVWEFFRSVLIWVGEKWHSLFYFLFLHFPDEELNYHWWHGFKRATNAKLLNVFIVQQNSSVHQLCTWEDIVAYVVFGEHLS